MRYQRLLAVLSLVVMARPCCAEDVPDASPQGDFARDLEIPEITRFRTLPQRWNLEPEMVRPETVYVSDRHYVSFFTRMLRDAESTEIQQQAAEYLSRLARTGREDISPALETIRTRMASTESLRVRHACAMALLVADDSSSATLFLEMLPAADESTRLLIEPALAKWGEEKAIPVWVNRLDDPFATVAGYRNAAAGLAALGHRPAVKSFADAVGDAAQPFSRRMAAAKAIVALDSIRGRELAQSIVSGSIPDRLLCVALLSCNDDESVAQLTQLCSDDVGTVAAAAWETLLQLRPEALIPLLDDGRRHGEPMVRMASAEVMRLFPEEQRCKWLIGLVGDIHIEVRNKARASLHHVAVQESTLQGQIIADAESAVSRPEAPWQQVEQALVLLCELKQPQAAVLSAELLEHERGEVAVTAAWAMHLFPQPELLDVAIPAALQKEQLLKAYIQPSGKLTSADVGLQVSYLYQMCGLLRDTRLEESMTEQFSKAAPGGVTKRAAAMWSLGLLHEDEPDSPLIEKMEERINDTEGMDPEAAEVRQACIISIGRMRGLKAKRTLLRTFSNESVEVLIPQSVRWVMQYLDQPVPKLPPPPVKSQSGFPLESLRDDEQ